MKSHNFCIDKFTRILFRKDECEDICEISNKPDENDLSNSIKNVSHISQPIDEFGIHYHFRVKRPEDLEIKINGVMSTQIIINELYLESYPWIEKFKDSESVTVLQLFELFSKKLKEFIHSNQKKIQEQKILRETLEKLEAVCISKGSLTLTINDPSGLSKVLADENKVSGEKSKIDSCKFVRTHSQDKFINNLNHTSYQKLISELEKYPCVYSQLRNVGESRLPDMESHCTNCQSEVVLRSDFIDIPFFQNIIVMCSRCDICGHRDYTMFNTEPPKPKGIIIKLKVIHERDLMRLVCKSRDCIIGITELDFQLQSLDFESSMLGTLGDIFMKIADKFGECVETNGVREASFLQLSQQLRQFVSGSLLNVTVYLDDPSGHSYVQNLDAPDEDPNLEIVEYVRTQEQNESLCIQTRQNE